ncbi:MAG: hypothetical protein R2804_08620 [Cyclobacteriaceae bacterium]
MKHKKLDELPLKERVNSRSSFKPQQKAFFNRLEGKHEVECQEELLYLHHTRRQGIQLEIDHAINREGLLTKIEKGRTHSILIAVYNLHFIQQFPIEHIFQFFRQKYDTKSLFNYRSISSSPQSLLDYAICAKRSQEENNQEDIHRYMSNEVVSFTITCLPGRRCALEVCSTTSKIVGFKVYPNYLECKTNKQYNIPNH